MNHILHNISVILLLVGIILMTNILSKDYKEVKYPEPKLIDRKKTTKTSEVYNKMFKETSPWMGYADYSLT